MARISEVYFSTLSALMKPYGLERHFRLLTFVNEHSSKLNQGEIAEALQKDKVSILRSIIYPKEDYSKENKTKMTGDAT